MLENKKSIVMRLGGYLQLLNRFMVELVCLVYFYEWFLYFVRLVRAFED